MATDPVVAKYLEKFVDGDSGEPVKENGGCWVEFYMGTQPDGLLTDGGVVERGSAQVAAIRRMEKDSLALLRTEYPFTDVEPQPPAKDAAPSAQRAYTEDHAEWDERRLTHEADLKEKATILREHHEHKELFTVRPAGRPIFVDREFIRIMIPGDKDNIIDRPVRQSDMNDYRAQYNRWKEGKAQASAGTPLSQWPKVTPAQVEELAYFKVRTIEQLAATSDSNLQNIGPYMAKRQEARDWIATARGSAPIDEARAESRRVSEENAELKRQMAELSAAVAEMRGAHRPAQVQPPTQKR